MSNDNEAVVARKLVISSSTLVPLGFTVIVVLAILGLPVVVYSWFTTQFAESARINQAAVDSLKQIQQGHYETQATQRLELLKLVDQLTVKVDKQNDKIDQQNKVMQDRWTLGDQTVWYLELKQRNPTLNMPDPRAVSAGKPSTATP